MRILVKDPFVDVMGFKVTNGVSNSNSRLLNAASYTMLLIADQDHLIKKPDRKTSSLMWNEIAVHKADDH